MDDGLVWCMKCLMYEFSFCIFSKTNSNWPPFHCYFEFMKSFYFEFFYIFKSFLWSNQFTNKHFFNHFFETLFEWHAWNCQELEKVWIRWWRLTRELPQFELVSGHKMCLGFPNYGWYEENDWDLKKKLPLVWKPRMVLGCKSMFDFSQMRRLKNDGVFTSCSWCDHSLQCK